MTRSEYSTCGRRKLFSRHLSCKVLHPELCKAALTCPGLSGSLFLKFFLTCGQFLSTVAAFWTLLSSRKGFDSMERVVMGDKYRYRKDMNKLRHFRSVDVFSDECVFHERRRLSPQTLRGRCCTQSTDVLALVKLCRVQLLSCSSVEPRRLRL